MFTERWDEIKEKLLTALELQPAQRSAYLAQIGAVDPELRKELDSLIASHEQTGTDFLNTPVAELSSALAARGEPSSLLGQRIGPYQIVEQIGFGGMGEVYRAFRPDDEYLEQVAIKLIVRRPKFRFRHPSFQRRAPNSRQSRSSKHRTAARWWQDGRRRALLCYGADPWAAYR